MQVGSEVFAAVPKNTFNPGELIRDRPAAAPIRTFAKLSPKLDDGVEKPITTLSFPLVIELELLKTKLRSPVGPATLSVFIVILSVPVVTVTPES